VLALLARGQSVQLWRQPLPLDGGVIAAGTLPPFCRYALVPAADPDVPAILPQGWALLPCAQPPSQPKVQCAGAVEPVAPHVYLTTSGSTGQPKIVAYTHAALRGNAQNCIGRLELSAADRVIVPVPLAHMYGLGAAFLPAVAVGASVRLVPEANLVGYLHAEAEFDPTVAFLTPSFAHLLLKGRKQRRDYRLTVLAGDRAGERFFTDYERRHGRCVHLYGSTELGVIAAGSPQDSFAARRDTAGLPLPGVRVAPPAPESAASGGPFALHVTHPSACAGYAGDDGRPAVPASLQRDGWYATADLCELDPQGRLQLSGRSDHVVKRDGMLVAFADVERCLQQIDGIDRAVVVAGDATARGRELVAVCTRSAGDTPDAVDAAAATRAARRLLPGHAVPDRFLFLDALPLTATAKPDRQALSTLVIAAADPKEKEVHVPSG
jgi:acyl-coenzyme A synthetase/AMP-(fatty) acid ligase